MMVSLTVEHQYFTVDDFSIVDFCGSLFYDVQAVLDCLKNVSFLVFRLHKNRNLENPI